MGWGTLLALAGASALAWPVQAQQAPVAAAPAKPAQKAPPASRPAPAAEADDTAVSEVVVSAAATVYQTLPGAVVGDIQPELMIGPAEIQSYGVSTVTELLDEIALETGSSQGRGGESPVVLLNGKRISGFNEVQNIPTEAILRVDILPEEVALKYGFTADQKVVNFVLRPRFRSLTSETTGGGPTASGQVNGAEEADSFRVRGDNRINLDVKLSGNDDLTYASRGLTGASTGQPYALTGNIVSATGRGPIDPLLTALAGRPLTVVGVPASAAAGAPSLAAFAANAGTVNTDDLGKFRDLSGAAQNLSANLVMAQALGGGYSATFNATVTANASQSLQGLPTLGLTLPAANPYSPFGANVMLDRYVDALGPLHQNAVSWDGHLGGTLNKQTGDWRINLTAAYDHNDSLTETGAGVNPVPLQALLSANSPGFNPYAPITAALLTRLPNTEARSLSDSGNIQGVIFGPLLKVPAGKLNISLKLGDSQSNLTASSFRLGLTQNVELARNDLGAQVNVDLPLTSKRNNVLPWMGDLSINTNAAIDRLSDFGSTFSLGYGLTWQVNPAVRLIVSHSRDEAAPSVSQLGSPTVQTPGVSIFDFATGQTVNVTTIAGANPNLIGDARNVFKVGLTLKPWSSQQFTINANYVDQRTDNPIGAFPAATAAIEAAFPNRFIRDAAGDLTEEDQRPTNFDWTRRQNIRWGVVYSRPVGKAPVRAPRPAPTPEQMQRFQEAQARRNGGQGPATARPQDPSQIQTLPPGDGPAPGPPPGQNQPVAQTPPADSQGPTRGPGVGAPGGGPGGGPGFAGRGGRGGGGFGGGQAGQGRFEVAVYHTVYFADQTQLAPGAPLLDFLAGAPSGKSGGQPVHAIQGQMGYSSGAFGSRINATWVEGTTVQGGTGSPSSVLTFSDLTTINLRLFVNFGQLRGVVHDHPWLRGARLTFNLYNVFDQQLIVKDPTGVTPLGYQAPFLDATGRTFAVSFRKLMF